MNPITLVNPETRGLVDLDDASQISSLVEQGFRPASPEELQAHALKQHYKTFGQAAAAAGEGALDTLLPAVGPALERALGVSEEDQRYRAAFHPIARLAGSVGAGIAGAAVGGPLGGALRRARRARRPREEVHPGPRGAVGRGDEGPRG